MAKRRIDNFNILVNGGHQDEDMVSDGWTDIIRNLGARRHPFSTERSAMA